MRFKVDENLPEELAELLRDHGHDAVSVRAQGLQGQPDSVVFDVSSREGRVLITLDQGFTDIRTHPPREFPGRVVLRLARQDKQHILTHLSGVVPLFDSQPLAGRLWVVEESQVRIRS
jgi:predicted nuclease of predicted toxin-antitoxin system